MAEIAHGTMLYFDNPKTGVKEQTGSIEGGMAQVHTISTVDAQINGYRRVWTLDSTAYFEKHGSIWVIRKTDAS